MVAIICVLALTEAIWPIAPNVLRSRCSAAVATSAEGSATRAASVSRFAHADAVARRGPKGLRGACRIAWAQPIANGAWVVPLAYGAHHRQRKAKNSREPIRPKREHNTVPVAVILSIIPTRWVEFHCCAIAPVKRIAHFI